MDEKIKEIFFKVTGKDFSDITTKTKLKKLDLTSLSIVEIICSIEDEFDIEIPNSELKKFKTVGDMKEFLQKTIGE